MASYKNIKIKMKGGKSRMQRVQVLASGKYKFVKNLTKSKSSNPKSSKKKTGKVKKMAKRKTRRNRQMTIPLALVAGAAAGAVEPLVKLAQGAPPTDVASWIIAHYTGYKTWDNSWSLDELKIGIVPLLVGAAVHKFIGGAPLNVNRMLGAAGVPLFRI